MKKFVDLDATDAQFLITFRGARVEVSKERLTQLLEREQDYFGLVAGGKAPARSDAVPPPPPGADEAGARHRVTHASLSARIKKIYTFTFEQRRLRAPHVEMILDLIDHFDWSIPDHPNTRLDQQLAEFCDWESTPAPVIAKIREFLKRYTQLRTRAAAQPRFKPGSAS